MPAPLLGTMMDRPLLVSSLIEHAAAHHGSTEVVSRTVEGGIHRCGYADVDRRARRLAQALRRLGVGPGDRVGTLAWNGYRHLELYYGVSGMGAVCHTINPRLFPEQLVYIVEHAGDGFLFVDLTFVPLVQQLLPRLGARPGVVVMTDRAHMPPALPDALCYEELVAAEDGDYRWPELDERAAASLCYTSGTTGNPKGALYSHRSTVLHAWMTVPRDVFGLSAADTVAPVVPMFHVNAWGVPYAAPLAGAKLVLPGPRLDAESLYELFAAEGVTATLGVPTVWLALLRHLESAGLRLPALDRVVIGGAAAPPAMIRAFEDGHGVRVIHAWGMTEMSPLGVANTLKPQIAALPAPERAALQAKQGRAIYGVELKVVDAEGRPVPHDGTTPGELLVRGPAVIASYFRDDAATAEAFDAEGWFRTGDVATLDPHGYLQITDRRKDVIKSGGEWISSIALENAAMGHPDVAEAAVIGVPHPEWGERPLLIVVPKAGRTPAGDDILRAIAASFPRWALPDDVVLVGELPHTATGKLLKTALREQFAGYTLPAR